MLQDTIELRSKGWVQRRAADGPKKIEEVHQEAKRELMAQRAAQEARVGGVKVENLSPSYWAKNQHDSLP